MKIYKYRNGTERDIKLLQENKFYSASVNSLNDILEAKVIIENEEFKLLDSFLNGNNSNSFTELLNNFITKTKKYGIYSLSKTYSNELLWAYYADSHKGFCIEYDFDILKKYQLASEGFYEVNYQETMPIIKIEDMNSSNNKQLLQKLLATKSNSWKHEEEIRFITGKSGVFHYYNKSITAIYFGYHTNKQTISRVMNSLKGRGIKYYKIYPKNNLYSLFKKEIKDEYIDYVPLKIINKFIPDYDEELESYKDLVEKAINIFMREKISGEIIDVYISKDKSTPKNPMFFITYKDKIRNMIVNYWINKKDIIEF